MANFLQDSFFEFCECLLFVHQLWTLVLWSSQASQIAVVAPCAVCGMRSAEYHLALLPLLSVYSRSTSHRHSAATSARSLAPGHRRPHTQHRSRVIANAFAALARTKSGGIQRGVRLHIAGISSCTNRVSPFLSCGVLLLRVIQSLLRFRAASSSRWCWSAAARRSRFCSAVQAIQQEAEPVVCARTCGRELSVGRRAVRLPRQGPDARRTICIS